MKITIKIVLIALLSFLAEQVFPWWSVVICAAVISALVPTTGFRAFLSGFAGVGLLWLIAALVYSIQTDFLLTDRVAALFSVHSSFIIIFLTILIGGLAGGMGALFGNQLRQQLLYTAPYSSRHRAKEKGLE